MLAHFYNEYSDVVNTDKGTELKGRFMIILLFCIFLSIAMNKELSIPVVLMGR